MCCVILAHATSSRRPLHSPLLKRSRVARSAMRQTRRRRSPPWMSFCRDDAWNGELTHLGVRVLTLGSDRANTHRRLLTHVEVASAECVRIYVPRSLDRRCQSTQQINFHGDSLGKSVRASSSPARRRTAKYPHRESSLFIHSPSLSRPASPTDNSEREIPCSATRLESVL